MSAVKRSLNVGVVGMGKMGVSITRNLAFKARSAMYLQLHSRTLSKARKVSEDMGVDGATCAMRLHDKYSTMTKWCDIVLLTLRNVDASRHVLLEHPDAMLRHARKGQIIVDHTTVDAETSRECAFEAKKRGALFLDVPMSGSPKVAFNGQLTLMAGGDSEAFQRCLALFRMYADNIHHMGDSGSGSAAKAISQMLVAVHNTAAAEAMKMANVLGVEDYQKLVQVLDSSWGSSTMLRRNAPTMQDLIRNPERVPPSSSASVEALLDDLSLLSPPAYEDGMAAARGSTVNIEDYPLLANSVRVLEAAANGGVGASDMSSVIHFLEAARASTPSTSRRHNDAPAAAAALLTQSEHRAPQVVDELPPVSSRPEDNDVEFY
ncbi:6-phosphogluconate dehydrogenase-like, putative [Bodo saltans]|uniref:6-phosphogluconate dehydrogenase-like, putative n=1 Tax=Bodo saltans TaxID=75058 RepID=A0A0S4JYX1_BODSA|nr:6-phosphogluconate dehydrogenase-like, putative [Bodo saltans]|eukprot:CUG94323.1 6-phosphogluconate dehydrogenase-like, putative [Bodo saltans]